MTGPELVELVRGYRRLGRTVVFTNGCFDVLHRGHVGYLAEAKPQVRRLGGQVRILGYVPDRSTSAIIERIRARTPVQRPPADDPAR